MLQLFAVVDNAQLRQHRICLNWQHFASCSINYQIDSVIVYHIYLRLGESLTKNGQHLNNQFKSETYVN